MTEAVLQGIEQVRQAFPECRIEQLEDGQGGTYLKVHDLSIGETFVPSICWVVFPLSFQYPRAQVYPHYLPAEVARADGVALTPPMNPGHQCPGFNEPAIMVSRSSQRWNPATDTAALKLLRVLEWLRAR